MRVAWVALVSLVVACGRPAENGRQILERSAAALRATQTVEYDFVFGHPADPTGYATGRTLMRRAGDAKDGWIRVIGHVRAQPQFKRTEERFDYGLDGERARLANLTGGVYSEAPRGAGANALALNAVYGYLTEFIEAKPLWKELESAKEIEVLDPETVDGVLCDVVRTTYDAGGRQVEVIWSISRNDSLPRRGRWVNNSYSSGSMTFTMTNLRRDRELKAQDFVPVSAASLKRVAASKELVAIGEEVPDWELATVDGGRLGSKGLEGKIVVLDFWNTWCFICRAIAPQTRALAREIGDDVQFVGVNLFETGDAAAYWRTSGARYPAVLAGESLASMLDVASQPAVAVIDGRGRLRYTEVGATADRVKHIREAIERSRKE
jgi:thiol-disulfide isomerase/thioredoxin